MSDDADRVADMEARRAEHFGRFGVAGDDGTYTPKEPLPDGARLVFYRCRLGEQEVELPKVQVLTRFEKMWTDLEIGGWERAHVSEDGGKVTLVWKKGGAPRKPSRPGSR